MALQATDELSAWFEVDSWTLKCDTLTKLADISTAGIDRHSIATMSLALADEAIVNSDWGSAEKLLVAASRVNVRLKDRDVVRAVTQKRKQLQTHKKLWEEAEQAATLLATSPDDAPANLKLGRFRCFVKGDWDAGLPHLAKGSDEQLVKLAEQDTQGPQGGEALALANQWYEWGEKALASDKNGALLRAKHWYTSALPSLSGLDRTVATKKLEELKDKVDDTTTNSKQLAWLNGPVGELKRLEGHTGEVTCLDVSRSGTMLVSGSNDGTVRFWDLAEGKETGQIRSSVSRISQVAFIRDDQFVLVAGSRTTAEIWNVRTGRPATSMAIPSSIGDAALSDDDKIFVCARRTSSSGNVSLYDMGTGAVAGQLNCPSYPTAVTLSRTGRLLAAGSGDNNIYLWSLGNGQLAAPFTGLSSTPNDVAISPNEQLVAACVSNQVMIWEIATGKLLSQSSSSRYASQLVFAPDSHRLLSAGMMHEVSVINVEDGRVLQTLTGQVSGSTSIARAITYLPDPRGAVSAGYDGVIRVWRLPD
ncbi:MAG: WD40 repeat domain-containing protein [Planctomycetota bacterium]|nr:WD40 repeat domain-containing protein [Planctomycetota bacterium]